MVKNYKKVLLFFALAFILTGCATPKTTSNTDNADISATGSATATATTPQIDTASFDADYQKNYTQALTSVNTYFQNQAKFCSVIVDFPQSSIQFANQYFFFSASNDQVKDWYGVVEIDPLTKTAKRQLAAKKDYADAIQCETVASTTPPNFSEAYVSFIGAYPIASGDSVAKTQMALIDNIWRITAWDSNGGVIATQEVSTTAVATTSVTATATSAL